MADIIKCKFAGDPEDEFCSQCDGLHPVDDNGNPQPATECGGYEAEEQVQEIATEIYLQLKSKVFESYDHEQLIDLQDVKEIFSNLGVEIVD